jgi:hypothetical protein
MKLRISIQFDVEGELHPSMAGQSPEQIAEVFKTLLTADQDPDGARFSNVSCTCEEVTE